MDTASNWYEDPALLTAEVKRSHAATNSKLEVRGYDDLVELARGGQGIVYRAVQRSTRRKVAIKVLLDGSLASGAAQRRFEREIDLVASLRHPNIVSVYDSGTTDDDRLYLVMEFVEGVPLDQLWAGKAGAPIREALAVIAAAAEAVQYAHQRGVIHRDLKPSNIRVDSARQPHILDFGLAKAAGRDRHEATLSTTGQFMGSLPWASPEQASGAPDAIDVRTDVYALGVILHQVLTGRFPYDVTGGLKATLDNILTAEPSRADKLRPEVGDEVATIIAKSLSKDPERRYQSAGEVARDIRRYLAGEPIEAKGDSAWYTVSKTLRRYRLAAGAAAAFIVLLSAALVVSIVLARAAKAQELEAKSQAARLGTVNEFVLSMLDAVDPDKDGPNTKIVDLLDRAAQTVDVKYAAHDDLRESLHDTLRKMYDKLSLFPKARAEAELLVELRKRTRGENDPDTLSAEAELASTMSRAGQAKEAVPILERVLAGQRKLHGPLDQRSLATLTTLAQCYRFLDRAKEAADLCQGVLPGATSKYGPDDRSVIILTGNLGSAKHDLGDLLEAERLYRDVIPRWNRVAGPDYSETLIANNNLGTLLILQNRLAEAETLYRAQLDNLSRRLPPDHADVLGAKSNFSKLLQDMNKMEEAEKMMLEALEGRIKVIGEDHPHTLVTMNNVGSLYAKLKRLDESERYHRRTLALRSAKLGPEHSNTVISMNNLAGTLRDAGKLDEALGLYEQAVSITDRTLPAGHYFNALFRSNLGVTLYRLKRYPEAEEKLVAARQALVKALGSTNPQTRQCSNTLADLYEATGRPELAAPIREELAAPTK